MTIVTNTPFFSSSSIKKSTKLFFLFYAILDSPPEGWAERNQYFIKIMFVPFYELKNIFLVICLKLRKCNKILIFIYLFSLI